MLRRIPESPTQSVNNILSSARSVGDLLMLAHLYRVLARQEVHRHHHNKRHHKADHTRPSLNEGLYP
jgi:hypothetical protein